MNNLDTLKQVERRIYLTFFQDGLWDMALGLFLLSWGLVIRFYFAGLIGALTVGVYFTVWGLKRWLTYPRLGYARPAGERRQKMKMVLLGTVVFLAGLAIFLLTASGDAPGWFREYFMFIFTGMLALVTTALAAWWRVGRWYSYAGLIILGGAAHQWLGLPVAYAFLIPGGIIAILGGYLLASFLRRYPKPENPEAGDLG